MRRRVSPEIPILTQRIRRSLCRLPVRPAFDGSHRPGAGENGSEPCHRDNDERRPRRPNEPIGLEEAQMSTLLVVGNEDVTTAQASRLGNQGYRHEETSGTKSKVTYASG